MAKYKITFDFNLDEIMDYDDDVHVNIQEIDDQVFYNAFSSKEKVQEFEEWYNKDADSNEEIIKVIDIEYEGDYDTSGIVYVNLESDYKYPDILKDNILNYLFDIDYPIVEVEISGTTYEDYWDYKKDSPEQRTVKFDNIETYSITSYNNAKIVKI